MHMRITVLFVLVLKLSFSQTSYVRINQLGYTPSGIKVAVWGSLDEYNINTFQLIDSITKKVVFANEAGKNFGIYGPFKNSYRLNFTGYTKPGVYYIKAGNAISPFFRIDKKVYSGSADFLLNYMRQQQCGFNPHTKDSCHTHDGYTLYGPMPDSTHIDVTGGWHDAADYLQYSATSANATYHLLAAYRDFPTVFKDYYASNGLQGKNNVPDVLDCAKWGLDWLQKMHPKSDWMFNQIADDRDHRSMRMPKEDDFYGKGFERPVYFCSGKPQQQGKNGINNTTGVASTAGKFSSAFALGFKVFNSIFPSYATILKGKAFTAYEMGKQQPGNCQTASVLSPYIYAEDNWTDDMELAAAELYSLKNESHFSTDVLNFSRGEKVTPWLGKDTAKHYQWYPFINLGHYAAATYLPNERNELISYYKKGIEKVFGKARYNAFYRGIPFIWCSNNLTVSFAIQCLWYKNLSGDDTFDELMQANVDWLFGCNPWGTSMVYGLPAWGDTPVDPHAAFSKIGKMPVNGGLVDGPVYTSIFKNLIGIRLTGADEYEAFQSDLAVYHDDYGDYSTNEPTMDGTASLVYLLAAMESGQKVAKYIFDKGAIQRGNTLEKQIALVFTGDEFADGGLFISKLLAKEKVKASFFFTGNYYANPVFKNIIYQLKRSGNYLGPHSDNHILYADWNNQDSTLVSYEIFKKDLAENYRKMTAFGIQKKNAKFFLPPYEWYNQTIADWTSLLGLQLINYSSGTLSHADYTTPDMGSRYKSSETISKSIFEYERKHSLNGFILLSHIGTHPSRANKFYFYLPNVISEMKKKGYRFVTIDQLLK